MLRLLTAIVCAALLFGASSPGVVGAGALAAEATETYLTIADVRVRYVGTYSMKPGDAQAPAVLVVFGFEDAQVLSNHAKLIELADHLFGAVVLEAVEKNGLRRAVVGFLKSPMAAGSAEADVEDFEYARRDDAVWLRQAGTAPWKVAQDPGAWMPPTPEIIDLEDPIGKVEVPLTVEINAPKGYKRALAIEMRTDTPVMRGRKWEEMRALWQYLDHDKLKAEGFDYVRIENYEERQRGRFHVRQMAFFNIPLGPNGEWAKMPEGPLGPMAQPEIVASLQLVPPPSLFEQTTAAILNIAPVAHRVPSEAAAPVATSAGLGSRRAGQNKLQLQGFERK